VRERKYFWSAFVQKNHFFIRAFYFVQNHFWSSEEIFFIGKKCKIFILTVSFFAKNILEFGRKKFGGGEKLFVSRP
jgi:hypothetical protein